MPHRSSVPSNWRQKQPRYNMMGSVCEGCEKVYFPSSKVCECGNENLVDKKLVGVGEVHSFTTIRVAPDGYEKNVPYTVAVIQLKEGPRVTGHIVNSPKEVKVGQRVHIVFRRIFEQKGGLINYGFKFQVE